MRNCSRATSLQTALHEHADPRAVALCHSDIVRHHTTAQIAECAGIVELATAGGRVEELEGSGGRVALGAGAACGVR
jgi:hypothetical protein